MSSRTLVDALSSRDDMDPNVLLESHVSVRTDLVTAMFLTGSGYQQ